MESFKKAKNRGLTQSLENMHICGVMEGNYTQKRRQIRHGQRKTVVFYHEKLLSSKSWKSIVIKFGDKSKTRRMKTKTSLWIWRFNFYQGPSAVEFSLVFLPEELHYHLLKSLTLSMAQYFHKSLPTKMENGVII